MNSTTAADIGGMLSDKANERTTVPELNAQDQLEMHLFTECHEAIFNYLMTMRNPSTRTVSNLHEYATTLTKSMLESTGGLADIKSAGEHLAKEPLRG